MMDDGWMTNECINEINKHKNELNKCKNSSGINDYIYYINIYTILMSCEYILW
jgi:hypothetical protein